MDDVGHQVPCERVSFIYFVIFGQNELFKITHFFAMFALFVFVFYIMHTSCFFVLDLICDSNLKYETRPLFLSGYVYTIFMPILHIFTLSFIVQSKEPRGLSKANIKSRKIIETLAAVASF